MALSKLSSKEQLAKFEIKELEELEGGKCSGSGSFGTVFKVKAGGVTQIAKRLHNVLIAPDIRPEDKAGIRERFNNECLLLSKLDHPCIVQFVGVHFHGLNRSDVTLVMECLHTDLDRFLDPKERPNIPLSIKLSILLDVSAGLLYLHHQLEEPLVHRDLKAENILITNDLRAKIADLGVSKLLKNYPHQAAIQTKCPGTLAYMPPEALCEDPQYDTSLDIFSYGQLALYTAIQQFPQVFNKVRDPKMTLAIRLGESEILKRKKWIDLLGEHHCLRGIILQCLKDDSTNRPKTSELKNTMNTLCVIHPKSLADVVSTMEEKADVMELKRNNTQLTSEKTQLEQALASKVEDVRALKLELEEMELQVKEKQQLQDQVEVKAFQLQHLEEQVASMDSLLIETEGERDDLRRKLIHLTPTDDEYDVAERFYKHVQLDPQEADTVKLKKIIAKLTSEKAHLEQALASKVNDIRALKPEFQSKEDLQSQVVALQIQVTSYKADFEEERRDREAAHGKMADMEMTIARLEGRSHHEKAELEFELDKLSRDQANVKEVLQQRNDELEIVTKELEKHKKILSDLETVHKRHVQEAGKEIQQLTRQVQEAGTQMQQLTSQVSEAKSEQQAKVSQVKQYAKENEKVKGKNEKLKLQLSTAMTNLGVIAEEMDKDRRKAFELQGKLDKLKKGATPKGKKVYIPDACEAAEKRNAKLEELYNTAMTEVQSLTVEKEELTKQVGELLREKRVCPLQHGSSQATTPAMMKQYQEDFRQEREDRETAHGLIADMEKECIKGGETSNNQQLSDRLREAEEANKRLLEDLETVRREVNAFQQEIIEKEMIHAQLRKELEHSQAEKIRMEERLIDKDHQIKEIETKFEAANSEVKTRFTQLHTLQSDNSWNFQRKEVEIKEEIGRGASGLVSKGQFRGQTVAVKQIHQYILTQKHVMDEFKREVKIMAGIQHPNLVRFVGAVFDQNVENFTDTPLLLLELLHTNLRQGYERFTISLGVSVSIFRDVAYGLHYLHEHQEPIIHRDVSAPNVLLEALPGGMWRAKLSDFGSANFLKRSLTLGTGAIVYTAPEMFPREDPSAPVPRPTTKCDVFSYGIVLVEVITKTMPSLENRHELFAQVQRKWKMMYDLISQCTQQHPQNRPTMLAVLNTLNKIPVARPR